MSNKIGKMTVKRFTWLAIPIAIFIFAFFFIISTNTDYSYWFDEIFSVAASSDNWHSLFWEWLVPDVHPPLYQAILKLYISVFGNSERVTRFLSFIFSVAMIFVLLFYVRKNNIWHQLLILIIVVSNSSFLFYAQETRAYSLMMLCATIFICFSLKLNNDLTQLRRQDILGFYVSGLVLSLTHYFGFIYVLMIFCISFFDKNLKINKSNLIKVAILIFLCPILHIIFGMLLEFNNSILSKTGGHFWIKVQPFWGTFKNYWDGTTSSLNLIIISCFVFIGLNFLLKPQIKVKPVKILKNDYTKVAYLLATNFLFVLIIMMIDFHTPISTPRNFTVLIPGLFILVSELINLIQKESTFERGISISKFLRFTGYVLFVISLIVLIRRQIAISISEISFKQKPLQNYSYLSSYIESNQICQSNDCFILGGYKKKLIQYYMPYKVNTSPEDFDLISDKAVIISFHSNPIKEIKNIDLRKYNCYRPEQAWGIPNILIPESTVPEGIGKYLVSCDKEFLER